MSVIRGAIASINVDEVVLASGAAEGANRGKQGLTPWGLDWPQPVFAPEGLTAMFWYAVTSPTFQRTKSRVLRSRVASSVHDQGDVGEPSGSSP